MEINIPDINIDHEKYNKIVNYLRSEKQKIRQKGAGKPLEDIYDFYSKGRGNPPRYTLNIKVKSALEEFPEESKKVKESLKGLINLLYS